MKPTKIAPFLLCVLAVAVVTDAAEPVAGATTNWPGIAVKVMAVERKAGVLTVKWAAENASDTKVGVGFAFTGRDVCYVLDEENGVKYYALTDKEGHAIASGGGEFVSAGSYGFSAEVPAGGAVRVWMKLPAPPPEVSEISIFLNNTEPIEGVAIVDR